MKTKNTKTQVELLEEILTSNGDLAEAAGIAQAWAEMLEMDSQDAEGIEKEKLVRIASKFKQINTNVMKTMEIIRENSINILYRNHK